MAQKIVTDAANEVATLQAQIEQIEMETQNEKIQNERDTELYEDGEKKKLEIELQKQLGTIESGKFKQIVDAIG